jgi:hypothetical protein
LWLGLSLRTPLWQKKEKKVRARGFDLLSFRHQPKKERRSHLSLPLDFRQYLLLQQHPFGKTRTGLRFYG